MIETKFRLIYVTSICVRRLAQSWVILDDH